MFLQRETIAVWSLELDESAGKWINETHRTEAHLHLATQDYAFQMKNVHARLFAEIKWRSWNSYVGFIPANIAWKFLWLQEQGNRSGVTIQIMKCLTQLLIKVSRPNGRASHDLVWPGLLPNSFWKKAEKIIITHAFCFAKCILEKIN